MTTNLPLQFGKYTAIERLGEGGFGEVYPAVDTTLNRSVALKLPHRELFRDPSFVAQFRRRPAGRSTRPPQYCAHLRH